VLGTLTVTAVNYRGSLLPAAKLDTFLHQHTTYAGANLILFCHPVYTDYHYRVLTSNRSVSETEIQRIFTAATLNWSYVCAQEIRDISRGGTWDTVYFIRCKTQNARTWKCLILFQSTEKAQIYLKQKSFCILAC